MAHLSKDTNENIRNASIEDMRAEFASFEPRYVLPRSHVELNLHSCVSVRKLLDLVPSTMLWALKDRAPLETWIHADNKVCLLGDAGHPMLVSHPSYKHYF